MLGLLTGCVEKDFSISLEEKVDGKRLTILAVIDNGFPVIVLVSSVHNVDEALVNYWVEDATVVLHLDGKPIDTIPYYGGRYTEKSPSDVSIYSSPDSISLVDMGVYHVTINAPGYEQAETEHLTFSKVFADNYNVSYDVFDTLSSQSSTVEIQIASRFDLLKSALGEVRITEVEPVEYYYRLDTFPRDTTYRVSGDNFYPYLLNSGVIFGYDMAVGSYVDRSPRFFAELDYISLIPRCISVVHYTDTYLKFAEPYTRQERENIGGLGTTVRQLPSNINGGYGYFAIRDRRTACAFP